MQPAAFGKKGSEPSFAAGCMIDRFGRLQTFVVFDRPSELRTIQPLVYFKPDIGFSDYWAAWAQKQEAPTLLSARASAIASF